MKVLFISAGDYKYGAPKAMFELFVTLKKEYSVEPVLLTKKRNELNHKCDLLGIENYAFWSRDIMAGSAYQNPIFNMMKHCVKYLLYLWGGITQKRVERIGIDFASIDIIHTNLNRNDIGVWISQKYKIPHVWHLRETLIGSAVAMYKPNVIDYMNKNASLFVAISQTVYREWAKLGLDKDKMRLVYDGLNAEEFTMRNRAGRNSADRLKIVMTGHVQPTKGQDQLISALGRLASDEKKKLQIDIYGEAYPDYRRELEKNIHEMQLEDVVNFCGYCDHVPKKLAEYDIGIVASRQEGFGRVTVEYMLAGLLVIASDTGANTELIEDGKNGLIYPYKDIDGLTARLKLALDAPELIEKLGKEAHTDAVLKYSNARYAKGVYELYREVLEEKTREV